MKKTLVFLGILILALSLTSCLGPAKVNATVKINWDDRSYYTDDSTYYLAYVVGTFSTTLDNIPKEGVTNLKEITPDESEYSIEVSVPAGGNATVFVYQDKDGDKKYSDDDQAFDSEWVNPDDTSIDLDVYY
ncbi:hypothetical protein XO10_09055 [Marinitoga sp. 1135]|uniref:Uncharacterized protein n=1 Tax=Marinitoga piezophila (strain DSM 14283 / JCM 11233 / KA3) TaxID=443254 RepID=H2J5Z6_MARPK|nr:MULTISPECIES: hypothetical protein [Marinitoga]AEX86215.1 hypothetical protein Marpi_1834 [Marinitoga piezophila KA3]APT76628.1 hypothetical protein LN42_09740 [Marinitoga sp. 1137]NUU96402.1 hypothetical protein [Marinitoga sp. 1135]